MFYKEYSKKLIAIFFFFDINLPMAKLLVKFLPNNNKTISKTQ